MTAAVLVLLLAACGQATEEPAVPESVPEVHTEPAAVTPTEPREEPAHEEEDPVPGRLASGNLAFWVNGQEISAGDPVSRITDMDVELGIDPSTLVAPGQISGNISARVEADDLELEDETIFFFHAINDTGEPKMISQCRIYSLVFNMQPGIMLDSGDPEHPFVSRVSTMDELKAAYGEPDYYRKNAESYEEMAYYAPFDSLYFSFGDGILRQVAAVYAAGQPEYELPDFEGYFGNDAYLLMGKYLDITPYLHASETDAVAPDLEDTILLGDMEILMGTMLKDLPERFSEPYQGAPLKLAKNHYILSGKSNGEEFYLLNKAGKTADSFNSCAVIGVVTHNAGYTNWGSDHSEFLPFAYQGLHNGSRIEDVIQIFGLPRQMHMTASAQACFVWMNYTDSKGNTLSLRVDPMTNQLAELRILQYVPGAVTYQ